MIDVYRSDVFDGWLRQRKDIRARAKVEARILRLSLGNPGDVKSVGAGIGEMRIDYGPGYRVYYQKRGAAIVVLLCGGDKSSQQTDIEMAKVIAAQWTGN